MDYLGIICINQIIITVTMMNIVFNLLKVSVLNFKINNF